MQEIYNEVPSIISSKDLDYLSDMFEWNYGAYKKTVNFSKECQDNEIKQMMDKASNVFHGILTKVLNILQNGGNNE